jgi:hypothetical protein
MRRENTRGHWLDDREARHNAWSFPAVYRPDRWSTTDTRRNQRWGADPVDRRGSPAAGGRVIVRFGEPEIIAFRLAEPQVPLPEGTTIVLLVEDRLHSLVLALRLDDFAAIVRGDVKQRGQNLVDGIQTHFQGQLADRTCVSKNAAIPRVSIKSGVGHVIIPLQEPPQEDDSRSVDRIRQVGRPAVDADEQRSSADDLGRFSDAGLATQVVLTAATD